MQGSVSHHLSRFTYVGSFRTVCVLGPQIIIKVHV